MIKKYEYKIEPLLKLQTEIENYLRICIQTEEKLNNKDLCYYGYEPDTFLVNCKTGD